MESLRPMVSKIGENTVIVGNVHGDGDLEIMGRVLGDVTVEGNVTIAAGSEVKGSVSAASITVAGTLEGNLEATNTAIIEAEALVLGDMTTPRIAIGEGAVVRGMLRTAEAKPTTGQQRAPTLASPVSPAPAPRMEPKAAPPPPPPRLEIPEARRDVTEPASDAQSPHRKKGKHKQKRPPEPKVPALAKGTKGKKKGDKH